MLGRSLLRGGTATKTHGARGSGATLNYVDPTLGYRSHELKCNVVSEDDTTIIFVSERA